MSLAKIERSPYHAASYCRISRSVSCADECAQTGNAELLDCSALFVGELGPLFTHLQPHGLKLAIHQGIGGALNAAGPLGILLSFLVWLTVVVSGRP